MIAQMVLCSLSQAITYRMAIIIRIIKMILSILFHYLILYHHYKL